MAVVCYENGILAIEVLIFYFAVVFSFDIFPFPPSKNKLLGDFHVIIILIMRLTNGAPMPPAPLVIAHRKRKNPENLI